MGRTGWILAVLLGLCLVSAGWAVLSGSRQEPLPRMRVEVLNGCGVTGLATRTAIHLRSLGQDVVVVDDFGQIQERTILIDHAGRPWRARRLAERLGGVLVVLEEIEEPRADLTLILGADHAGLRLER